MLKLEDRFALILNSFAFLIFLFYLLVDSFLGVIEPLIPIFIIGAGSILGFTLFRLGNFTIAKICTLLIFYFGVYLACAADTYESAVHLYFMILGLASFVVFGYEKLYLSIFFVFVTLTCNYLAYLTDFSLLPEYNFSDDELKFFFILNTGLFAIIASFVLFTYRRMIKEQSDQIFIKNLTLEKTNKEMDYLLYSASHDLKAPLATLSGLIEITKNTESIQEKGKYEELMKESIQKMDVFIEDVISVFRNSKLEVTKKSIVLNNIVREILDDLEQEAKLKNVKLIFESSDIQMLTDPMRLKSILRNLISNAIKYSDSQKSESFVKVSLVNSNKEIQIDVEDNGIGISKAEKGKIFNLFYRANDSVKGDGLGLFIAKEMINALDGEIEVESEINSGSKFSVLFKK